MKYMQIIEIKTSLAELGKEKLPIAYEIAKNIRMCNQIIQETQDINKTLVEKFCDKSEDGTPKDYPVENHPEQTQLRIGDPELLKQYQEAWMKALDADHKVDFVKIPKLRIQSEKLLASMLVPLVDTVIED
jgi:hypothetical protein